MESRGMLYQSFKATVAGNANYIGATSAQEPFTVDKAQLLMDSQVHNAAHVDKTNASVPLGSVTHDTGRVTVGLVDRSEERRVGNGWFAKGACDAEWSDANVDAE